MSSAEIYKEIILDYYRHPRNYGKLEKTDGSARETNPLCGDDVEIQFSVADGKFGEIRYSGKGCAISQASTSMLTELAKGKQVEWVKELSKEDVFKMLGNPELGPARVKCALLGMKALKVAAYGYLGSKFEENNGSDS
ncbi:MAG: SUF system NifU family Fe-S cluster assembly protein [Thaumarchaeota archaeon]|nr:SUF system NifU family Fe-S cluster assembly protein [Nitrososphaerota archaeon]